MLAYWVKNCLHRSISNGIWLDQAEYAEEMHTLFWMQLKKNQE